MKFTLSWLKDHLETKASLEQIVETLTMIGLEVEEVVDPAKTLGGFVTAKIEAAEKHPDADRLKVCKVNTGSEIVQVVCGAPNAKAGMIGVFAPVGTYIPGLDVELKKGRIRGVDSLGMMCSESELELSEDHDGIIELSEDIAIGQKAFEVLGANDPMIEIGITPNRPDCLGVYGIARDLAAAGLGELKETRPKAIAGQFDSPIKIDLQFDDETNAACPHFTGLYIKNVKNGPSPDWMQKRLKAIGLRPINALVDMTNYISYDRGRPLHVYDADKVQGNIHARMGKAGDKFTALDGKDYEPQEDMCVIADDSGAIGFGGIMGGESTGSQPETVNVFIESAYFDAVSTAMTGRATGILSDARYRFERGIDPNFTLSGLYLAAQMVMDLCGGEPSHAVIAGDPPERNLVIEFPWSEVKRLTGLDISNVEVKVILHSLGFFVSGMDEIVHISAPSWRPDIQGKADLAEEIVRIVGLDKVAPTPLPAIEDSSRQILSVTQKRVRQSKRMLASRGMIEVINWSFIPHNHAKLFGGGQNDLQLMNPLSQEMSDMRPSLIPGLLCAAQRNADRSLADIAIFEVGQAYKGSGETEQQFIAAGVRRNTATMTGGGRHWRDTPNQVDVFDAKADALAILSDLGVNIDNVQIQTDAPEWYHPGQSGRIMQGPKICLAHFGALHPLSLEALDVKGNIVGFEVFLEAIPQGRKKTASKPALSASDYQPVKRDFAFVMADDISASIIMRAAKGADKSLISDVQIFDVFAGGSLDAGTKSVAVEMTLQPKDATLTDEEINAISAKLIAAVEKSTKGKLRS